MGHCTEHMPMNDRIKKAGIKITGVYIKTGNGGYWTLDGKIVGAHLEYKNMKIIRPKYKDCAKVILDKFNLEI